MCAGTKLRELFIQLSLRTCTYYRLTCVVSCTKKNCAFSVLGRVHAALISSVSKENRSVTVEWFEGTETKGKEVRTTPKVKNCATVSVLYTKFIMAEFEIDMYDSAYRYSVLSHHQGWL